MPTLSKGRQPRTGYYCVTHKASGRCYVGVSKNLDDMPLFHPRKLYSGLHSNSELQKLYDADPALAHERIEVVIFDAASDQDAENAMCDMAAELLDQGLLLNGGYKPRIARNFTARNITHVRH
jgi:hypothetical protein